MNKRVYEGHFARKRFGQNFLQDSYIIDSIISAITPKPGDAMVEIGPGLGALTLPITKHCDHLTLIEIDRDLAARLHMHPELEKKITLIEADAMKVNFSQLAKEQDRPLRVFGNLPYNISTSLLFHLFQFTTDIADMHFMLQKEVVNRLVAAPDHKAYGRLSVMAQYYCQIMPILDVPPSAFRPAPKVDSAVVRLIPHDPFPYPVKDIRLLSQITTMAFNQRRKTLRNSLGSLFSAPQLTSLGIDANKRAENVTVAQYVQLANFYFSEIY